MNECKTKAAEFVAYMVRGILCPRGSLLASFVCGDTVTIPDKMITLRDFTFSEWIDDITLHDGAFS